MTNKIHKKDLVTVATFNAMSDAERLKSWLESEGLPAVVLDETKLQKYWFMTAPRTGVHVQTTRDNFEQAHAILNSLAAVPYLSFAVRCPSCGSVRVQYPDLTRKNLLPTLVAQIFVLIHVTRHKYYCEDCHFTWRAPNKPASRHTEAYQTG
jgi:hypothetical protein